MEFVCKLLYELTRICNLFLNMYTVPNTIHIDTNVHSLYITFLNIINSTLNSVYLITHTEIFTPSVTVIKHMSVHLSQKLMSDNTIVIVSIVYTYKVYVVVRVNWHFFLSLFPASLIWLSFIHHFQDYLTCILVHMVMTSGTELLNLSDPCNWLLQKQQGFIFFTWQVHHDLGISEQSPCLALRFLKSQSKREL